mmetsp:Transcript_18857/g.41296  ORF Transcript_18857/g.41296 Transcript_18857/m.41296 type:complete len:647 (-) Transcript_18857:266-2206(-)
MRVISCTLLLLGVALQRSAEACTTVLITSGASATGVPMILHTLDCWDCDNRIGLVPSKDHAEGSKYDVFGNGHQYPSQATDDGRAWIYRPEPGLISMPVLGKIPEVNRTYAYWESNYALMNEHGLTIGESSCAAALPQGPGKGLADDKGNFGEALFSIAALIRLAINRCKTAVCAVETMGQAAYEYGFYGEGMGSGEALTIVDTTGDGWMFHVSADPSLKSALWAAQRVEDGHVAVVANDYTMRVVDPDDPNTMHSANLFSATKEAGLWDGEGPFDWSMVLGRYNDRPWYDSVRKWSVQSRVAPSMKIPPKQMPYDYDFSVPADEPLDLHAAMGLVRHYYEDTEFALEEGFLAGFFGLPYRMEMVFEGGSSYPGLDGMFARPLSLPRTAYSLLGYPDPKGPVAYICTDQPATGVYAPFLAKTLTEGSKMESLKDTMQLYSSYYANGIRDDFSRDSAWWAFDFVSNWMTINFKNMSRTYVYPAVKEWQEKALDAAAMGDTAAAKELQDDLVEFWWGLADKLVVRYNDNYLNFPEWAKPEPYTIGYDQEMLKQIGYSKEFLHPVQVVSEAKCNSEHGPDAAPKPMLQLSADAGDIVVDKVVRVSPAQLAVLSAVAGAVVFCAGILLGARVGSRRAMPNDTANLYRPLI